MTDLVQKLRHLGQAKSLSGYSHFARETMLEAAKEIEHLRAIKDLPAAEAGWRTFWHGFSEHLELDRRQKTYGWHELMDACNAGLAAVKSLTLSRNYPHREQ